MGLGLIHGRPQHDLTRDWYATGDRLATWIERELPCFVGNVPVNYTEAVVAVIRKHNVPLAISRDVFSKLDKRGVRFDWPVNEFQFRASVVPQLLVNSSGARQAPQVRAISKGESARGMAYTFEEYERRYVLAIKTNDAAGAEQIIAAVLELLIGLAKGYGRTRQDAAARNEKMAEWEEFNTAVDEAMDRARTLQTHIRYITREELKSLRDAPTPTSLRNLTIRFASRVTTRTVPPARRGRR